MITGEQARDWLWNLIETEGNGFVLVTEEDFDAVIGIFEAKYTDITDIEVLKSVRNFPFRNNSRYGFPFAVRIGEGCIRDIISKKEMSGLNLSFAAGEFAYKWDTRWGMWM